MFAVIPAAGLGTRLGEGKRGVSKALVELLPGQSLLELSIRNLLKSEVCKGVAVTVRPSDRDTVSHLLRRVCPSLPHLVVDGGDTRQASVFNALRELVGRANAVMIHDAARPFVEPANVKQVAAAQELSGAALLAVPITSTLKQVSSDGHSIQRTVPRAGLWEAQTPQCFRFDVIYRAHQAAREAGYMGTDDCELVERLGIPVTVVKGSFLNVKITSPEDLELGKALLMNLARTHG